MADFRINVIVDPGRARRGVRDVENGLNRAGNAADRLRRRLEQAFTIGAIGLAVRQIVRMADTLTNLNNRLRLVTKSEQELVAVNRELFDIANRTRSSFEGTAELFARLGIASKELGVSNQELLQFTESLNQAIILSGASAVEAQAGLIQLSQGMASGTLRGDELRSVLEQLPAVADVIAKQLGVTRGELRQMGADGEITAKVILDAFKAARQELAENFATTIPTVGQAMTVLRNNFLEFLGAADRGIGITEGLAQAILTLANNMDALIPVAAALATVLGVQLARVAIPALITGIASLWAIITAHPIGLLITVLAALVAGLLTAQYTVGGLGEAFGTTGDTIVAFGQLAWQAITSVIGFLGDLLNAVTSIFPFLGQFNLSWQGVGNFVTSIIEGIVNAVDFMRAAFVTAQISIIQAWEALPGAFERIALAALNGAIAIVEDGVNGIISLISEIPFVDELVGGPVSFGRLSSLTGAAAPVSGAQGAAAAAGRDLPSGLSTFDTQRGAISDRLEGLRLQAEQARIARQAEAELNQELQNSVVAAGAAGTALGGAADNMRKIGEAGANAVGGVKQLSSTIQQEATFMEQALQKVFNAATDALVHFVQTGEFDFKKFVNSLLADLTRLAANQLFQQILGGGGGIFGGGGGGGIGGLLSGLLGFQHGGGFEIGGRPGTDRNVLSLNGRPVARVSRGERVDVSPEGGGGRTTVVMNIQTPDADSFRRSQEQILNRTQFALDRARRRNG